MDPQELMSSDNLSSLIERGIDAGTSLALAALILIVGLIVAGGVRKAVRNAAVKSDRIDDTLGGFFSSIAYYGIMAIVVIAVLNRFGVETTSLVAALGAATLAIGLALQGTLSNLAAGVMIILFRPYKLGDFVEVAGQAGSVKDITLFTTELATGDNKKVIVPDKKLKSLLQPKDGDEITYFNLQIYMKPHYVNPKKTASVSSASA